MDGDYVTDKAGGYAAWETSEGFLGGKINLKEDWPMVVSGIAFLIVVVLVACWLLGAFGSDDSQENMCNGVIKDGSASGVQYYGEFSGANQGKGNPLAADAWDIRNCQLGGVDHFVEGMASLPGPSEEFIGGRETPYFSDVTNRVLRLENREKDAIRALAKINQERLRRQAERPDATVPWDSHWAEWKRANPLGEEQLI